MTGSKSKKRTLYKLAVSVAFVALGALGVLGTLGSTGCDLSNHCDPGQMYIDHACLSPFPPPPDPDAGATPDDGGADGQGSDGAAD
jgi:hypothetical protein